MGSRTMHLAISGRLLKELPGMDRNRFLLGSVLPDAAVSGNSHRKILVCGGKRTYDLTGFRSAYADRVREDPLYLGFYLHLVQDMMFRQYVYGVHHWDPRVEGNPERLHRDYELINPYLVEKYGLSPDIRIPAELESEPLFQDSRYEIERFLTELRSDFTARPEGEIFFFHPAMADAYIDWAFHACFSEIRAVKAGDGFLDEMALAWG